MRERERGRERERRALLSFFFQQPYSIYLNFLNIFLFLIFVIF